MIIGVPKEIMPGERRVSATPETVKAMRDMGLTVLVQKDAGEGAYFHDPEYIAAGAEIVENPAEIFERADMILKVKEPQFNNDLNKHEADMMHEGQYLITFTPPAAPANHAMVKSCRSWCYQHHPRLHPPQNLPCSVHGRPHLHEHLRRLQRLADGSQSPAVSCQ